MEIETIHNSLINGQRRQMVNQINEYGCNFWKDYAKYLTYECYSVEDQYDYFVDATASYANMTE